MNVANPPDSIRYPLLDLFHRWQTHDRSRGHKSLDTDTYLILHEALERGVGLWNLDELKTLCKLLLVKPHHHEEREQAFERMFREFIKTQATQKKPNKEEEDKRNKTSSRLSSSGHQNDSAQSDHRPTDLPDPSPAATSISDTTKTKSATEITHVAFRHDAQLVEGISWDTNGPNTISWEVEAGKPQFQLQGKYLPVEGRSVQQAMRSLRQLIPLRQQPFIDLPATIRRVARRGYFDRVVTRQSLTTRIPLVLLLDRRGSMVAFQDIVDQWADAARKQDPPIPVYYFQNCPVNCVFSDPWLAKPVALADWEKNHPDALILILSDAGAARGLYSEERLTQTRQFLKDLRPRRVAWLNPMPRYRWWRSTAASIARSVPMFALDGLEFSNAFQHLKGKLLAT